MREPGWYREVIVTLVPARTRVFFLEIICHLLKFPQKLISLPRKERS